MNHFLVKVLGLTLHWLKPSAPGANEAHWNFMGEDFSAKPVSLKITEVSMLLKDSDQLEDFDLLQDFNQMND